MRSSLIKLLGSAVSLGAFVVLGCGNGGAPSVEELCGNGKLEEDEGEECEDGNSEKGDGCFECRAEKGYLCINMNDCRTRCGDGIVAGDEVCDSEEGYCLDECTRLVEGSCGDGIVQTDAGEECDNPGELFPGGDGAGGAGGAPSVTPSTTSNGCDSFCRAKYAYRCDADTNLCGQVDAPRTSLIQNQVRPVCEWLVDVLGGPGSTNRCTVSYQEYIFTTNDVDTCVETTNFKGSCSVEDLQTWASELGACSLLTESPSCIYE